MKQGKKVCILGAGHVGATIAYTLTIQGIASEIVLIDIDKDKAKGEAMDIIQGTAFSAPINLYAGEFESAAGADIVVVTVGARRSPGQTRLDLAKINIDTIKQLIPMTVKYAPDAVYIVVSNPVDILTYVTTQISGLPHNRVIGSGTILDSARLRSSIAMYTGIASKNVHAYVLGEHGDTSVIPWSLASIAGIDIDKFGHCGGENIISADDLKNIEEDVRTAGAKVIAHKGSTHYAVALSVQRICESILRDTDSVLTVSSLMEGQYGIRDICLSLPFVIGAHGIKRCLLPPLTPDEEKMLQFSAQSLGEVRDQFDLGNR